jgi:D-alanine-D-alanine ligase
MLYNLDPAWPEIDAKIVVRETKRLAFAMSRQGHPVTLAPVLDFDIEKPLEQFDPEECILFNWCESIPGIPHSEALAAEALEELEFTCTGSTADVISLSENKRRVKRLLDKAGIPSPKWRIFESVESAKTWDCFPAIVKAANEHCSAGMTSDSVVLSTEDLRKQVAHVLKKHHQPALVEDFIDGREFHVTLWGNRQVEMLPLTEVDFSTCSNMRDRLYMYETKFNSSAACQKKLRTTISPSLSDDCVKLLERTARDAYRLLGCRDYARIDIRQRYGLFYVLDVNPNADITSEDSVALSAKKAGYCYGAMGSHLVNLAAQRHPVFGLGM